MLLSLFPQILFLAPAGTTILRIAAAICFAYIAADLYKRARELEIIEVPLFGHMHAWMVQLGALASLLIAVLLFFGAWTQGVALLGALSATKSLIFFRRYSEILTFSKSTYWLLLCICLMLAVTGSGAFAFDLPL